MDLKDRHPSTVQLMSFLEMPEAARRDVASPPKLMDIQHAMSNLAVFIVGSVGDSPELSAGLRKLLEARDCFTRAAVDELFKG